MLSRHTLLVSHRRDGTAARQNARTPAVARHTYVCASSRCICCHSCLHAVSLCSLHAGSQLRHATSGFRDRRVHHVGDRSSSTRRIASSRFAHLYTSGAGQQAREKSRRRADCLQGQFAAGPTRVFLPCAQCRGCCVGILRMRVEVGARDILDLALCWP